MKKAVSIFKIGCFLVITNCTMLLPYTKNCVYGMHLDAPAGSYSWSTTHGSCRVDLTQQDRNKLSQVLTPMADNTIKSAMEEVKGVVHNVLNDFNSHMNVTYVHELLQQLGL